MDQVTSPLFVIEASVANFKMIAKKSIMNLANIFFLYHQLRIFTTDDDRENRVFCLSF